MNFQVIQQFLEKKKEDTSNVNPIFSPRGVINFKPIWEGGGDLIETGGLFEKGGLI